MIQKHKLVFKHLLSFNSRFLSFIREYTINNQRKNYLHFLLMKVQRDNNVYDSLLWFCVV